MIILSFLISILSLKKFLSLDYSKSIQKIRVSKISFFKSKTLAIAAVLIWMSQIVEKIDENISLGS